MSSSSYRISVVIPVRNGAAFLPQALESVWNQTVKPHECLVVDDGSTDDSAYMARNFGGCRVISITQRGVSKARNTGIAHATGDLVAFLDVDDVWLPTKLEAQSHLFKTMDNLGLAYCGLQYVNSELMPIVTYTAPPPDEAILNALLLKAPPIGLAQTGVAPRSILEQLGGFDERLSTCADLDLTLRIAQRYPIARVVDPLVKYRQHENQMSRDLQSLEADVMLIIGKMRDELVKYRSFRRAMLSRLKLILAMAEWRRGARVRPLSRVGQSLIWHPPHFAREVWRLMSERES